MYIFALLVKKGQKSLHIPIYLINLALVQIEQIAFLASIFVWITKMKRKSKIKLIKFYIPDQILLLLSDAVL